MFSIVIDPERAGDFDALNSNLWPDLREAMEVAGFRNYTGFRRGAHVVYYGEFYPNLAAAFRTMATHSMRARWRAALGGIVTTITDTDGSPITAAEVYHLD